MNEVDYLVIGAGPAGLQLGYYLQRAGVSYRVLEKGPTAGDFFRKYPRHRKLISVNKVHTGYSDPERNLRFDWNSLLTDDHSLLLKHYTEEYFPSADALVEYLEEFQRRFVPNIDVNTEVVSTSRNDDGTFTVEAKNGQKYHARAVILATGVSRPYVPRITGIEHSENYVDVSVDPQDFVGQRVLVLGKGNSGFETADALIPTTSLLHVASPTPVKFAWKTHFPGHLRAVNNNFLDTYQLKTQNAVLDAQVRKIEKTESGTLRVSFSYEHALGEVEDIEYDRVIVCTGFKFDPSIFAEGCRPARVHADRFPEMTSEWESVNVPNLFYAGVITQSRDYKKTNSAFIHGFRYNAKTLFNILRHKVEGRPLPYEVVRPDAVEFTRAALRRIRKSSALWQQFGFLCDAIVLGEDGEARYYEELPFHYVHESDIGRSKHYYTISLEFGHCHDDPFNVPRDPDPETADQSFFLHPVVRRYSRGKAVRRIHLLENLFGEWEDEELHVRPLFEFFQSQMVMQEPPKLETMPPRMADYPAE